MPNKQRRIIYGVAAAILLVVIFVTFGGTKLLSSGPTEISTDKAIQLIDSGRVTKAAIMDDTNTLILTTADDQKQTTSYPKAYAGQITQKLLDKNVTVDTKQPSKNQLLDLFGTFAPMAILLVIFLAARPDALKSGKFAALSTVPETRFSDIAGADEAVAELEEIVSMMKDGAAYEAMGARPPKGAILVGPSGTGKTLLARAVAGESGLPFYAVAGSDFVQEFAGRGPRRVRQLFKSARKTGGVIFIDEIDSVGQNRNELRGGGDSQERLNVITALLHEMDGFTARDNIVVLAATNRVDSMDPALLRPGRLDRQVQVPIPDRVGREAIFKVHLTGKVTDGTVDTRAAAGQTAGMSGAEIAAIVNESCMIAVRTGQPGVSDSIIQEAVNVVAMGRGRKSAYLSPRDKEVTAYHEAGHATCALLLAREDPEHATRPTFVTIIPRGAAGGFTRFDHPDSNYVSKRALINRLIVSMGGRAAEMSHFGEGGYTSGAAGDLKDATAIARQMVMNFGMADTGSLVFTDRSNKVTDGLVQELLSDALKSAVRMLEGPDGEALVESLATALIREESLGEVEIAALEVDCLRSTIAA